MPIEVFGAGAVQTAYVSYESLDLTLGSITLITPTSYVDVPYTQNGVNYTTLAASMAVKTAGGNANTITLPDATGSSVGSNFIITNIGMAAFNLLKSDGSQLIQIQPDEDANAYWVQLTGNSTAAGQWQFVKFGAGTSEADASVLAGLGLVALATTLNTNLSVQSKNADYTVQALDRASLMLWTGGAGTITLPSLSLPDVPPPAGFYVSFNNEGTGVLTISSDRAIDKIPPIDGSAVLQVQIGQSLTLTTDGTQWWSLGLGQNLVSNLFSDGSAGAPSISFITNTHTGLYLLTGSGNLGISINGQNVSTFSSLGLSVTGVLTSSGALTSLGAFTAPNAIITGDVEAVDVILSGAINAKNANFLNVQASALTLNTPLPFASGGTGSATQQAALNALMPNVANGGMTYYNGTNWVALPPGDNSQVLTMQGNVPVWSDPA